jgi:hypothetical protein
MLLVLLLVISACGGSSGGSPDPGSSGPDPTSAAGAAALSSGPIDPETCHGVLGPPPDTHTLELQSLTDAGQGGSEPIDVMCAAVYETSIPGDPFLTVALIRFDADESAAAHFDLLKGVFVAEGVPLSEADRPDEEQVDWVSALMDRDGIGRTTVLRQGNWVMTVSVGPSTSASPWTIEDIQAIGESIIERVQR